MTVNPMKTAVDSLFNRLGRTATYKNNSVRLILSEPDEITEVGFVNAHSGTHRVKIRISDAPDLKVGDKIGMDGKIYAVRSEPVRDIHNLIWSCDLVCV